MRTPFAKAVEQELAAARKQFPKPRQSFHEALSIIEEEVKEFRDIVYSKEAKREPLAALKELVQIGAMAQRTAEDLGLIEADTLHV